MPSSEPRDSWIVYAIGNALTLAPGIFFMWLAWLSDEAQYSPTATMIAALVGGGLLVWAFVAIGERRSSR